MISWFIKQRKERDSQAEPQFEQTGLRIKCDCCGTETLAQVRGNKLVIMDKRHGKKHIAVLSLDELIALMKGFEPAEEVLAAD